MKLLDDWLRRRIPDPGERARWRRNGMLILIDLALAVVLVWVGVMVQALGYRIENTRRLVDALDLEYAELEAEVARERSPEKLRRRAAAELGLKVPAAGQVVTLHAE